VTKVRHVVRGRGIVRRTTKAKGHIRRASFAIDLRKGRGAKIRYADPLRKLRFHSTLIRIYRVSGRTATFKGVGLAGRKRVSYTIQVADHGAGRRDTFRIALSNGYRHGSRLIYGNVTVR